ncbi:hypothetical protein DFH27DRAFT_566534 [Peziza echinospora]|nr:hypothetical protein DFH27DRAFT_566534 [Peziza echinospora]
MTRVLLTGASGFIATHVLDILLKRGYSVRGTVRSQDKADKLLAAHKEHQDKLDFVIVEDIAQPGAFDKAVVSEPPFDYILHTASPFHFKVTDVQKDLLDPAVQGTSGILVSAKKFAPTVKRVVITSSFASIIDANKGNWPEKTYTEEDWNPITLEEGLSSPVHGYRASKTFAERAAWDFVKNEKPNFDLATINPPMVFGPVHPYISNLKAMNTSNERVLEIITGKYKDSGLPPTGTYLWVDVRDVALAHVLAIEKEEAGGKRFFVTAGKYTNGEIASVIKKNFPELASKVPEISEENDGLPEGGVYAADNTRSKTVLGLTYRSLEESITDLVKVLLELGAK